MCEYVPAVLAVPPHGKLNGTFEQVVELRFVVWIGFIASVIFTVESHPLVLV